MGEHTASGETKHKKEAYRDWKQVQAAWRNTERFSKWTGELKPWWD